jgi:hypothetical protein
VFSRSRPHPEIDDYRRISDPTSTSMIPGVSQRVPVGMGVVVPASRIAETLNQSELVKQRQEE